VHGNVAGHDRADGDHGARPDDDAERDAHPGPLVAPDPSDGAERPAGGTLLVPSGLLGRLCDLDKLSPDNWLDK
jgi:hypothetical protein